jgi:DNA-binding NarL/FixJ family response regulator
MDREIGIIIVDDHPDFLEGIEMFLQNKKKYTVLGTATNGEELLNHPQLRKADLVLLDCEMPIMSGVEAAKRVNSMYPYKKMIATTMFQSRSNMLDLIGAGFNGYVYKPNIGLKIESVIERVLNDEYVFDEKLSDYR